MDLGVDLDVWPWVWLVVAVSFTLIEVTILSGSFLVLPFALSAFAASLLGFYDAPIEVQWAVFALGGGVLWVGFYRWARSFLRNHVLPAGVGAERPVGMVGTVTVAVMPGDTDRRGRISVDGEVWGAISDDDVPLEAGTRARITAMRGTRAVIEPVESLGSDDADTGGVRS